jgi:hypothetical protein
MTSGRIKVCYRRYKGWPFALAMICLTTMACAGARAAEEVVNVIGSGHVGGRSWTVEAAPDGKGVCFEVAVVGHTAWDENGRGQCSYPAVRRGILLVVSNRERRKSPPALTAVGAAFNRAVSKVVVTRFNGMKRVLRPRSLPGQEASASVRRFRYLAFAVKGPWCARSVATYRRDGKMLWRVGWEEFDSGWRGNPRHNPATLCPR